MEILTIFLADGGINYSENASDKIEDSFCYHIFNIRDFRGCVRTLAACQNITNNIIYQRTKFKQQRQHKMFIEYSLKCAQCTLGMFERILWSNYVLEIYLWKNENEPDWNDIPNFRFYNLNRTSLP